MNDFETSPRGTVESLRAENQRLRELLRAVEDTCFGVDVNDVDGVNWFDARDEALK